MNPWLREVEQRKRIEQKLDEAKAKLGERWILHPANRVHRKTPCQPPKTSAWS